MNNLKKLTSGLVGQLIGLDLKLIVEALINDLNELTKKVNELEERLEKISTKSQS